MTAEGGLEVRLRLDPDDLALLRERLRHAATLGEHESEDALLEAALSAVRRAGAGPVPSYVRRQLDALEAVAALLRDVDWRVPASVRQRVRVVLCYCLDARDLIPDEAPLFGFLDDAIMIDLLARELRPELDAHARFARFRDALDARLGPEAAPRVRERELAGRRRALRARLQALRGEGGAERALARWFRSVLRSARA